MFSRRSFLQQDPELLDPRRAVFNRPGLSGTLGASGRASADDRVLVVIELNGGNDGINTVVPYRDEGYRATSLGHAPGDPRPDQDRRPGRPTPIDAGRRPPAQRRQAGHRAGSRLPQPEPVSLREHEDLAHRPPGRGRRRRLRLDRPGAGRTSGDLSLRSRRDLRRQLPIASRRARPPVGCDHVGSDR